MLLKQSTIDLVETNTFLMIGVLISYQSPACSWQDRCNAVLIHSIFSEVIRSIRLYRPSNYMWSGLSFSYTHTSNNLF